MTDTRKRPDAIPVSETGYGYRDLRLSGGNGKRRMIPMTEKGREKGIFPYPQRAGKGLIYSPVARAVTREEEWLQACHSSLTGDSDPNRNPN